MVTKKIPISTTDPKKGQIFAGIIIETEDGVSYFRKSVKRSKHYFEIIKGYAIQMDVFLAVKARVNGILIVEEDTGDKLYSDISVWDVHGGSGDWKHGQQKTLSEKFMSKINH